jgi:leucine dehydrogenase
LKEYRVSIFETMSSLSYGTFGLAEMHFGRDEATGMRAIVGIFSTRLGPAIGGSRLRAYGTEAEAVEDVALLARGMAYKAAIAGLPHGGGKAVLLAPPGLGTPTFNGDQRAAMFRSFGTFVNGLGGRYVTTEDSGTSPSDMDQIRQSTPHVLGTSPDKGGSGDPSPFTALGVRRGIEAIAHEIFGKADLKGLHVAIQGVGHVGSYLAHELHAAGARLTIADVDAARCEVVAKECGADIVPIDKILEVECDVLSPCALGGALTEQVLPKLKCKVIGGAANNQLRTPAVGRTLFEKGIFYAPDYAINGGGLINVAEEYAGYNAANARKKTLAIYDTIAEIIDRSKREKAQPEVITDRIAEERIAAGTND